MKCMLGRRTAHAAAAAKASGRVMGGRLGVHLQPALRALAGHVLLAQGLGVQVVGIDLLQAGLGLQAALLCWRWQTAVTVDAAPASSAAQAAAGLAMPGCAAHAPTLGKPGKLPRRCCMPCTHVRGCAPPPAPAPAAPHAAALPAAPPARARAPSGPPCRSAAAGRLRGPPSVLPSPWPAQTCPCSSAGRVCTSMHQLGVSRGCVAHVS